MSIVSKTLIAVALSALSTLALAGKIGPFIEAGMGMASQTCSSCESDIDNTGNVDMGFGGKIAGGFRFNQYVAVEVGYAGGSGSLDMGVAEDFGISADLSTSTFYGALVGFLPLSPTFELFARLGMGSSTSTLELKDNVGSADYESNSEMAPVFGAGISFTPENSKISWRAEYNHYSSDKSSEVDSDGVIGPSGFSLFGITANIGF